MVGNVQTLLINLLGRFINNVCTLLINKSIKTIITEKINKAYYQNNALESRCCYSTAGIMHIVQKIIMVLCAEFLI